MPSVTPLRTPFAPAPVSVIRPIADLMAIRIAIIAIDSEVRPG
jgi:hypothetical protein